MASCPRGAGALSGRPEQFFELYLRLSPELVVSVRVSLKQLDRPDHRSDTPISSNLDLSYQKSGTGSPRCLVLAMSSTACPAERSVTLTPILL